MARGNGKHAQNAAKSGKLSAYIKPKNEGGETEAYGEYVDWAEVDGRLLVGAIVEVNKLGGSLLFGHTRDHRSYSVMVFYGGDKTPYYFACTEAGVDELTQFLCGLIEIGGV